MVVIDYFERKNAGVSFGGLKAFRRRLTLLAHLPQRLQQSSFRKRRPDKRIWDLVIALTVIMADFLESDIAIEAPQ